MPFRQILLGTEFSVYAGSTEDRRWEIDEFLTVLEQSSPSDWRKLVSLIVKSANDGPPENDEVCRVVNGASELYEFVSPGGSCVVWFPYANSIILCLGYDERDGRQTARLSIARALLIRERYFREKEHGKI